MVSKAAVAEMPGSNFRPLGTGLTNLMDRRCQQARCVTKGWRLFMGSGVRGDASQIVEATKTALT